MLSSIPLLVVSFILYNLGLAGMFGDGPAGDPWQTELFSVQHDVGRRVFHDARHADDRDRAAAASSSRS